MDFRSTPIEGVVLIEGEPRHDERGSFERAFCVETFAGAGIQCAVRQTSISTNPIAGTLRGMHYNKAPFGEAKLVRCVAGSIFDVVVDLRPDSLTFKAWHGVELTSTNNRSLYIPSGIAHGFLSLVGNSVVYYMMDADHQPSASAGVRWNDPTFAVEWPSNPTVISPRDDAYPDFVL